MKSPEILVVSNNADTISTVKAVLEKDFRLAFTTPALVMEDIKKFHNLSGVLFELKGEKIEVVEQFTRLFLTYPRLKFLVLSSKEFYNSIDKEKRFGFWCLECNTLEAFREEVKQIEKYPVSTIEKIYLVDAAFARSPFAIAIIPNDDLNVALINRKHDEIIGYNKQEYAALGLNKNTHPDDVKREIEAEQLMKNLGENSFSIEKRIIKKDRTIAWVEQFTAIQKNENNGGFARIVITWDITNRKKIEEKLQESDRIKTSLLQNLQGMVFRCKGDPKWTMEFMSEGVIELTGYAPTDLINNHIIAYGDIIVRKYRPQLRREFKEAIKHKKQIRTEYEIIMKDGTTKWVFENAQAIYDEQGNFLAIEGLVIDIDHIKKIEKQLIYFQNFDQKLHIPNREFLTSKIQEKLDRNNFQGTLILVNLKESQKLYRSHGYQYVELLTTSLVSKLKQLETDKITLHYAEEDLYVYYAKYKMTKEEIRTFYAGLRRAIARTIIREQIRCGVGVIHLHRKINIAEVYLQKARVASEFIVHENRIMAIYLYDDDMDKVVQREDYLRKELLDVSFEPGHEDKLRLVFQPIFNLQTGAVSGFEALARFTSDKYGPISPLEFIPIVENNRIIMPFGKKIIDLAIQFIKDLSALGIDNCPVSINISVSQLLDTNFAGDFFLRIESAGISPSLINVEVTETIFSTNHEQLNEALTELNEYGIETAIDDFGTGFSSLERLEKLHFTTVKMDRIFVETIDNKEKKACIVPEIINICKKFNIKSLAEGIETEEQYNTLKFLGCDFGQGYYMSRPLEVKDAKAFIIKSRKAK
ncbi:MAG: Phytochrome-like protein cph2 [Tenericutes bacterium ADurb.Bin239]|nr:MAG: Phytochrome-like protein cph2 [Tenericutes bacterium ADurb.Bin239]